MTDLNKQELRRLAERASPAFEWYAPGDLRYADDKTGEVHGLDHDDDRFIAAANPAAILSLLDELDSLERNKEETLQLIGMSIGESVAAFQKIKAEGQLAHMRLHDVAALCATVEQERDRLRTEVEALRKDAERFRWASGGMHEAETLMSIVACHGGYAEKIAERVDVYMEANIGKPCGGPGCCQLCADDAGEVGNG